METLSAAQILNEASRLLDEVPHSIWDHHALPVPIDEIAEEHCGLLVREITDIRAELGELQGVPGEEWISGALIPARAEVWVDATEASRWPRRRRYTVAHELGHWVLHRGGETAFCREATIRPQDLAPVKQPEWGPDPGEPRREWEANVFGGALLMPPRLVRKIWRETGSPQALVEAFDCSPSAVDARWMHHYEHAERER